MANLTPLPRFCSAGKVFVESEMEESQHEKEFVIHIAKRFPAAGPMCLWRRKRQHSSRRQRFRT